MTLTNGSSSMAPIIPISLSNNSFIKSTPSMVRNQQPVNNMTTRVNTNTHINPANRFCLSSIYSSTRKSCG